MGNDALVTRNETKTELGGLVRWLMINDKYAEVILAFDSFG